MSSNPIGIVGAMPEEVAQLKADLVNPHAVTAYGRDFFCGELEGRSVVLVQGGIGKVRTTITAMALCEKFKVQGMMFTGVAGGLKPHLNMGDVVLGNHATEHDFGTATDGDFTLGISFIPDEGPRVARASDSMLKCAMSLRDQVEMTPLPGHPHPKVIEGTFASGDSFVECASLKERIIRLTDADAVEMEAAAFLRVAMDAGVPSLLIRTISDGGDSTDFETFLHAAAHNSYVMVKELMKHPDLLADK